MYIITVIHLDLNCVFIYYLLKNMIKRYKGFYQHEYGTTFL